MVALSLIGTTKLFSGRVMTLIIFAILIHVILNIIWMSFSEVGTIEDNNEKTIGKATYYYNQMNWFDVLMFLFQDSLCRAIYYTVIIMCPIDISKTYVLRENK